MGSSCAVIECVFHTDDAINTNISCLMFSYIFVLGQPNRVTKWHYKTTANGNDNGAILKMHLSAILSCRRASCISTRKSNQILFFCVNSFYSTRRTIGCLSRSNGLHDGRPSAYDAKTSGRSRFPPRLRTLSTSRILWTPFVIAIQSAWTVLGEYFQTISICVHRAFTVLHIHSVWLSGETERSQTKKILCTSDRLHQFENWIFFFHFLFRISNSAPSERVAYIKKKEKKKKKTNNTTTTRTTNNSMKFKLMEE